MGAVAVVAAIALLVITGLVDSAQRAGAGPASTLVVLNPGTVATTAEVRLQGISAGCVGKTALLTLDKDVLVAHGMAVLDLQDPGSIGLPEGCEAAAEIRSATAPLAAMVLTDETSDKGGLAAYVASPAAATNVWWLPRLSFDGQAGGAHSLVVMNSAASPNDASLTLYSTEGKVQICKACRATIPAGGAWRAELSDLALDAEAPAGGARLTVRQPAAVLALGAPSPDRWAAPAFVGQGGQAPAAARLPWVYAGHPFGPPTSGMGLAGPLGAGRTQLDLVSSSGGSASATLIFRDPDGKAAPAVDSGPWVANAGAALPLDQLGPPPNQYGLTLRPSAELARWAVTSWPATMAQAAVGDAQVSMELLLPLVRFNRKGRAAWLTVANGQDRSAAPVAISLYRSGDLRPVATAAHTVPAGGVATLDLDDLFPNLPAGVDEGWLRLLSEAPLQAVLNLAVEGDGGPVVAAYEAVDTASLGATLYAPWLRVGSGPAQQATDTPTPQTTPTRTPRPEDSPTPSPTDTETPAPSETPTAVPTDPVLPPAGATAFPTAGPPPDPATGWRRPVDSGGLRARADIRRLVLAPDGTVWALIGSERGNLRVIAISPSGQIRAYPDRRRAVAAEFREILRIGSLPELWTIDPQGRIWAGAAFFRDGAWTQVRSDEPQPSGLLSHDDRVALDADGNAWLPLQGQTECPKPGGCAVQGLRLVNAQGIELGALDLTSAEGTQGDALLYLGPGARAGGRLAARSRADQAPSGTVAIAAQAMYLLPDPEPIPYPHLGPPAPGKLRSAGAATAQLNDLQGALLVVTSVELQSLTGATPKIFLNRWDDLTRRWSSSDDLTGPGIPLVAVAESGATVSAAAYAADGTLWLGTSTGELIGLRDGAWFSSTIPLLGVDREVRDLLPLPGGSFILVATQEGVFSFDGQQFVAQPRIWLPRVEMTRP